MDFWKTVYVSPFKIGSVNFRMISNYIYRFVLGFTLSAPIIYTIMRMANTKFLRPLAKYGSYTLVIYLFSFVFNGFMSLWLNMFNLHTNEYIILDILSIFLCIVIVVLSVKLSDVCKKNKWTGLLLLGEVC